MAGMRTKIRDRGQLTLPRQIREEAHLSEGDPVEVELVPEGILLRPQKVIDSTQAWFWTPKWQEGEARASADLAAGRTTLHKSTDDFLEALGD
jgi:antitoxin PrlF